MPVIGQVPISPAVTAPIPLGAISATSIASLTTSQQDSIVRGTIVVTPTQSYVYTGYGSKTDVANYIALIGVSLDLPAHEADTTNIHGIADTSQLATLSNLSAYATTTALSNHESDSTNIHGIANTANLATQTDVSNAVENHRQDATDVHGIFDTGVLATYTSASNLIPRFLYGTPSNRLVNNLPTEPSFVGPGVVYSGGDLGSWHTLYVPVFIGNNVTGIPRLFLPKTGAGGLTVSASIVGADTTTGGFLVPQYTWPSVGASNGTPEDAFISWGGGSSASFNRGLYFIALRFSSSPNGLIYVMDTSITANPRPTMAEIAFRFPGQSHYHYESAKNIRVGSIIRRPASIPTPTWPPADDSASLHPFVDLATKTIAQFKGPTAAPVNANSTNATFVTQGYGASIQRQNDAVFPGPTLNVSATSPDGGYNYLASANPGAFNASTSTRFEVTITPSNPSSITLGISSVELYSRSTASGPTSVLLEYIDGTGVSRGTQTFAVLANSTWTLLTSGGLGSPGIVSQAQPFKIRVYGYGGSASSASGNWRIDGLTINGYSFIGPDVYGYSDILPLFHFGFSNIIVGGSGP